MRANHAELHRRAYQCAIALRFREYADDIAQMVILHYLEYPQSHQKIDHAVLDAIRVLFGRPKEGKKSKKESINSVYAMRRATVSMNIEAMNKPALDNNPHEVMRYINLLNGNRWLVCCFYYYYGYNHEEISSMMGFGPSYVNRVLKAGEKEILNELI